MKNIIVKVLSKLGLQKIKREKRGWEADYLRSLTSANVVLDIGAANGTPKLYEAFKGKKFILFEPLQEYKESLDVWKEKLVTCEIIYTALGNEDGTAENINCVYFEFCNF